MNKKSRHIRLGLEYLEKLKLLELLSTNKTKRQIAEKVIAEFFTRIMNNEESAKKILELNADLEIRKQTFEIEMDLMTKDGKIVRADEQ